MYPFTVALHVVLSLVLILVVILQPGKGGDVGAAFGGGSSNSMFGPRGPANILSRATTVCAFLFMVTSIGLSLYSSRELMNNANVDDELERLEGAQIEMVEQAPEE